MPHSKKCYRERRHGQCNDAFCPYIHRKAPPMCPTCLAPTVDSASASLYTSASKLAMQIANPIRIFVRPRVLPDPEVFYFQAMRHLLSKVRAAIDEDPEGVDPICLLYQAYDQLPCRIHHATNETALTCTHLSCHGRMAAMTHHLW